MRKVLAFLLTLGVVGLAAPASAAEPEGTAAFSCNSDGEIVLHASITLVDPTLTATMSASLVEEAGQREMWQIPSDDPTTMTTFETNLGEERLGTSRTGGDVTFSWSGGTLVTPFSDMEAAYYYQGNGTDPGCAPLQQPRTITHVEAKADCQGVLSWRMDVSRQFLLDLFLVRLSWADQPFGEPLAIGNGELDTSASGRYAPIQLKPKVDYSVVFDWKDYTVFDSDGLVMATRTISVKLPTRCPDPWRDAALLSITGNFNATRLLDGNVLVQGIYGSSSPKIYVTKTNTWKATFPMRYPRGGASAVLLKDGRVMVVGGYDSIHNLVPPPEIYSPSTNRWTTAAAPKQIYGGTLTLLLSGKVLLVGGGPIDCSTPEIYTPWTNTWTVQPTAPNLGACDGHVAQRLPNGRVLVHGGLNSFGTGFTPSIEYRPTTNTWFGPIPNSPIRQSEGMSMVLLSTGKVLLSGGSCRLCSGGDNEAWLYDPRTSSWSATGSMTWFRWNEMLAPLPGGRALVAGPGDVDEFGGEGSNPKSAEIYNAASGTWTTIADMHYDTHTLAVPLLNGQVLLLGGPIPELYVGG